MLMAAKLPPQFAFLAASAETSRRGHSAAISPQTTFLMRLDTEEHLVKTHREDGTNLDAEPIATVFTKRFDTEGRSIENLVLTLRWEQPPEDRCVARLVAVDAARSPLSAAI